MKKKSKIAAVPTVFYLEALSLNQPPKYIPPKDMQSAQLQFWIFCSAYMSLCRVLKIDKSDHGILIVVICRIVLVFNFLPLHPPENLRIYASDYTQLYVEIIEEYLMCFSYLNK